MRVLLFLGVALALFGAGQGLYLAGTWLGLWTEGLTGFRLTWFVLSGLFLLRLMWACRG